MDDTLRALQLIARQVRGLKIPWVTKSSRITDPYHVLISCIISLRTKDAVTEEASKRLFKLAGTPYAMVRLSLSRLQKVIYPAGFYHNKAKVILQISREIIRYHRGRVPDTLEELLAFKGVGRKTANLVLGVGYGIPAICVDTHVHRISNRLGWVRTHVPEQTEYALQGIIPEKWWIRLNTFLVAFGQNICLPVSPYCSRCSVSNVCKRVGVKRHR